MRGLWLVNLKKWMTGTNVGGKMALDVNVANVISTAVASYTYKERRFHLPLSTTIPKRTSSMVQLDLNSDNAAGTPSDIANTISEIGFNWNGDGVLEFGVGANAGAAASNIIATIGAGQTTKFGASLTSGNKIWVRHVKDTDITSGELLVTFSG